MSGADDIIRVGIIITGDEAETIIAFVKSHERDEVPEGMWDLHIKLWEALYE